MRQKALNTVGNSSLGYLAIELCRIDALLKEEVRRAHSRDNYWQKDNLRGLYISETEISALLDADHLKKVFSHGSINYATQLSPDLEQPKQDKTVNESNRLGKLVALFHLNPFEKDVLLLCLLPELDLSYERLFGYIQDDVTRRKPSVDLALEILGSSPARNIISRQSFSSESPLIRNYLVSLYEDALRKNSPLLAKSLKIEDRIRDYLLGFDDIDFNLLPFARTINPEKSLNDVITTDEMKKRLLKLVSYHRDSYRPIIYFYGAKNSGKQTIAEALCHQQKTNLLVADALLMCQSSFPFEVAIRLLCREARLQNSILFWDNFDILFSNDHSLRLKAAIEELSRFPDIVILAGSNPWNIAYDWHERIFVTLEIPIPDYNQRKLLWQSYLNKQADDNDAVVKTIASKFCMSSGQIYRSAIQAKSLAFYRNEGTITGDELYQACRQLSNQKLMELARKIEPRYTWIDIVLPEDHLAQLREMCGYVKYRYVVYDEWGFGRKLSLGKGLNALFAGPSGTGKTMAAEIIATELKLDLYKIDLSTVVSKYIGETEKNLSKIFQEAQNSNAILFFDEADSLFGKRSEVRDSHDRYANIEIAYLLQKMEEYEGIVILATNLSKNLDEAFARRMHFSIEFTFPDEGRRLLIWQKVFPSNAPLEKDIDLPFMARQFKISGGNIKNIALSAAFLAANNGNAISMIHLISATKREYQKMGKLCTETDFGNYFELVRN